MSTTTSKIQKTNDFNKIVLGRRSVKIYDPASVDGISRIEIRKSYY